jgi:ssDNA-binding Zn-finger/Zn-ribbon topoisomerase 1
MIKDNYTTRNCPRAFCKGRLVYRINRNTNEKFIGCDKYPVCKYTEPVEKEDELDGMTDTASVWE